MASLKETQQSLTALNIVIDGEGKLQSATVIGVGQSVQGVTVRAVNKALGSKATSALRSAVNAALKPSK